MTEDVDVFGLYHGHAHVYSNSHTQKPTFIFLIRNRKILLASHAYLANQEMNTHKINYTNLHVICYQDIPSRTIKPLHCAS